MIKLQTYPITNNLPLTNEILKINDNYSTLLLSANINHKTLINLNMICESAIKNTNRIVLSNVAVASAVTAYARIVMIPFKIDPNTLYTDTDSYFTTTPINPELLGDQLGVMKDEMKGIVIQEACFVGPKKYGYWYIDEIGNKVEKSVFAGVPRNSLTFNQIKAIFNGEIVTINVDNRFFKSFTNLSITIKNIKISIKNTNDKVKINNEYLPIIVNSGIHNTFDTLLNKFKNLIIKNINTTLRIIIF